MELSTGHLLFAAVFDRAVGARLDSAERFVRSLPSLFPESLAGCDLAWRQGGDILVVVLRLQEKHFGAAARRRLEFWCARAGVRPTDVGRLSPPQRASFFEKLESCEPRREDVPADRLVDESRAFFGEIGAPAGRKLCAAAPLLSMDVGGPGWEGVRWIAEERTLFVPGLVTLPAGDELEILFRFPGAERPLRALAMVVGVRGDEDGNDPSTAQPGYALALTDPSLELLDLLAAQSRPVEVHRGEARAHPRYSVNAPVFVSCPEQDAAPEEPVEQPAEPQLEAGLASARIDYATDEELAADYVANLSQGGAFVRTSRPSPVGTRLALSMRLPTGDELVAPALVVMVSERGMGVKFQLGADAQARLAAAIARISARPRRALVVDDDAVARRMLTDALQERGFEVLTANDGEQGLSVLADELLALDLLVSDVLMPGMDGETFVRTIRNAGGESDLAIVVVTASLDPELEKRLALHGADAVLDKALGPELIAQAADAVLERKRIARASSP